MLTPQQRNAYGCLVLRSRLSFFFSEDSQVEVVAVVPLTCQRHANRRCVCATDIEFGPGCAHIEVDLLLLEYRWVTECQADILAEISHVECLRGSAMGLNDVDGL